MEVMLLNIYNLKIIVQVIKAWHVQMKKANLDAYLREKSIEKSTLDYEKMASNPYLKLKKQER